MDYSLVSHATIESGSLLIDFATCNVTHLQSDQSVGEAAQVMAEQRISSIVVTDDVGHPIGILTEQDILHIMQSGHAREDAVRNVMSSPIVTVPQSMNTLDAYQLCLRKGIRHLVIVNQEGMLSGIVSETDFRLHMNLSVLAGQRLIASAMTRSVLGLAPQTCLHDALNLMQSHHDSCVVVVENERPVGILTERDLVRLYSGKLEHASLGEVMTTPVLTVLTDDSINEAAKRMIDARVRHLVVVDDKGCLAGLISEHDLTQTMVLGLIEDKAAAEGAFLNTLINTIPDLVWLKDPDGVYLACNARFESYFGSKEQDIVGKSAYDFLDRKMADLYCNRDRMVVNSGKAVINEDWLPIAEGDCGLFETIRTPMRDNEGKLIGVLGIARDITERKRAEENLRITASVFDNSQDGIVITDADNRIIDVNPAFTRITGYTRNEVLGKNPSLLKSGCHSAAFYAELWQTLRNEGAWRGEIWNRRKSGEIYAELLSISAIRDENNQTQRHVAIFSDISHFKAYEEELSRIAHYDALTGIPNRVLLADRMKQAMAQTVRDGSMMAVCYLDLDGFKAVNDTLGHEAGDHVLIEVANRIKGAIRGGDTLARLGGDEFVILLLKLERDGECVETLDRLLQVISGPIVTKGRSIVVGASIGVSIYPLDDGEVDTLLRHADQAMYVAKHSGKNRFHIYNASLDLRARNHREFTKSIKRALDHHQFELHYQPVVDLRTGRMVGAEALIRWRHPERGLLPPGEFLGAIKNTDLEIKIGEWVIHHALKQIRLWRDDGLDIAVSINISSYHMESEHFVEKLRQALAGQAELAGNLQVEMLETVAIKDATSVNEIIQACRELGVGFTLDDFRSGYSSLSLLRNLSVNTLKIDQTFVRNMLQDKGNMTIVQSILALARAFERQIVAGGVETEAQIQALLDMGCDVGQGYGIARPMTVDELANWRLTGSVKQ